MKSLFNDEKDDMAKEDSNMVAPTTTQLESMNELDAKEDSNMVAPTTAQLENMNELGAQDLAGLGQPAFRAQDPALMSPNSQCHQPGIFFLSCVRNQTSKVTLSEVPRHAIKSEECNQASCLVCPWFVQSRCSFISQEPERALQEDPPPPFFFSCLINGYIVVCWLKTVFFFSNYKQQ